MKKLLNPSVNYRDLSITVADHFSATLTTHHNKIFSPLIDNCL